MFGIYQSRKRSNLSPSLREFGTMEGERHDTTIVLDGDGERKLAIGESSNGVSVAADQHTGTLNSLRIRPASLFRMEELGWSPTIE